MYIHLQEAREETGDKAVGGMVTILGRVKKCLRIIK